MTESSLLSKAIIVLGIVLVLTALLYPSEQTGWVNFTSHIQNFPTFVNPFAENTETTTLVPIANGTQYVSGWEGADTAWEALRSDDRAGSFIYSNISQSKFNVTVNSPPNVRALYVVGWELHISCRNETDVQIDASISDNAVDFNMQLNSPAVCPGTAEGTFSRFTFAGSNAPSLLWSDLGPGLSIIIYKYTTDRQSANSNATLEVSHLSLVLYGAEQTDCSAAAGAWFPFIDEVACAIGRFGEIVWKGILFLVNGIIFIGQVLYWFGGTIYEFGAMLTFFFSIPDIPDWLQNAITVGIVAVAFLFLVSILRIVRGNVSPV